MKFNILIPELSVTNLETSKKFYCDILGFKVEYERVESKFCFISLNNIQLMLEEVNDNWCVGELEAPFGRGVNFQMEVTNVEAIYDKLKSNDIMPYKDIFTSTYKVDKATYVEKELLVQDPDGYLLRFQQTESMF